MIRKLAHMDAPVAVVHEMFRETEDWPQWMPGITSTKTLSTERGSRLVEVTYLIQGRRFVQHLECRDTAHGLRHQQVKGWFRSWEAEWTFRANPQGHGTTVSMALELDLGMAAGWLVPKRMLRSWMGGLLDDTIAQGRARSARLAEIQRETTQAVGLGQPLLQVFQTVEGFEVHFADRTILIDSLPASKKA